MALAGKIFIILISIDTVLFLTNVGTGQASVGLSVFNTFLSINATKDPVTNATIGSINTSGNWSQTLVPNQGSFLSQITTVFTLPIFLIFDFLKLIASFLFAPVTFLNMEGAPFEVVALAGGLSIVLYAFALVSIIRGGEL